MARRLPPLNALRAFEAAARHGSFTAAAQELRVTDSAVSQQVRTLERYLGTRLFKRLPRGLLLTELGSTYLPVLTAGFDRLSEATLRPAFGRSGWLADGGRAPRVCFGMAAAPNRQIQGALSTGRPPVKDRAGAGGLSPRGCRCGHPLRRRSRQRHQIGTLAGRRGVPRSEPYARRTLSRTDDRG